MVKNEVGNLVIFTGSQRGSSVKIGHIQNVHEDKNVYARKR